jgi:hypothetical protein
VESKVYFHHAFGVALLARLAVAISILLSGCATFEIYEPQAGMKIERAGSSCGQPMISTVQQLGDGVSLYTAATTLGNKTRVSLSLEIPVGTQAALASSELSINVSNAGAGAFVLSDFVSGAPGFNVPMQRFPIGAPLTGTNRMAKLSPPYGPTERFYSSATVDGSASPELTVSPPAVRVGSITVQPKFSRFVLTRASVGCVQ